MPSQVAVLDRRGTSAQQLCVLIVDDDHDLSAVLSEFLQAEGYTVHSCATQAEGVRVLRNPPQRFHMLLTDLKLPDGDGLEVVKSARAEDPDIVAAVMTGYASLESALKAIRLGAYDYVTKPFNFNEVEILIHNMGDKVRLVQENRRIQKRLESLILQLEDLSAVKVELARLTRLTQDGFAAMERRLRSSDSGPR